MKPFEKAKQNLADHFPAELRNTVFVCVIISLLPLMIISFLRDFLPLPASHRIIGLTYSDITFFIACPSLLFSAGLILFVVLLYKPAKPVFYNNGKKTTASKRIREYANEITAPRFSADNLSEKKKAFLLSKFPFCFPALSCIFAIAVFLFTLNIVFRPYILTMLTAGIFLVVSGFIIRKSKRRFPITANGFDYSDDENTKKLNFFTSNLWISCGVFLISGMFLKGYLFLSVPIVISLVVPYLYSCIIRD